MYRYCNRHGLTVITATAIVVGCHQWSKNCYHKHRDIVDTQCPSELSALDEQQHGQTVGYQLMKMAYMTNRKYNIDFIYNWMDTKFVRVRSPSSYKKIVLGSIGTGIIVNFHNTPLIVTNEHVTDGHHIVYVKCNHELVNETRVGLVVYRNPELDLALIYVSSLRIGPMVGGCTMESVTELEFGDEVISLGFGQNDPNVINMGYGHVVCTDSLTPPPDPDPVDVNRNSRYVKHTAGQYPGFSGGPTVNLSGKLVAVNSVGNLTNDFKYSIHASNLIENFVGNGPEFHTQQIARREREHSLRLGLTLQWCPYYGLNGVMVYEKFCLTQGNQNLNRLDIIVEINGQQIRSLDHFMYEISRFPDNNNIPVLIHNDRHYSGIHYPDIIRAQQLNLKWI
ncbi:uncharacterized protein LOC128955525 [Oppia nitens]|uniref:uncharacterized protein LOC128955525 n=1 Tax=Oppia nitens TaxID=1686743 RepID=UPI0023DA6A3E|nr:uncharacterized protein LOC128955525 [Oppia nitens]